MNTTTQNRQNGVRFENSLGNFFDSIFNDLSSNIKTENQTTGLRGFTLVNVSELDNQYIIELVAPGFSKENFKIDVTNNILTIEALVNKEDATISDNIKIIKKQFSAQSFKRSFTIDNKVDTDTIAAEYVNGVLKISLYKKEEVKLASKQIEVK